MLSVLLAQVRPPPFAGALSRIDLQLPILHHLNIRGHSGEKVKKLIVVDHVRITKLLRELVHTPCEHEVSKRNEVEKNCGQT